MSPKTTKAVAVSLGLVMASIIAFHSWSQRKVGLEKSGAEAPRFTYVKALYSLPLTFDPTQMNDTASLAFSELVYEGLLRLTPSYGVEGALAENWTTSDDGRTLTFTLRKAAKFHNGEAVKPSDVIASLSRAVAKQSTVFKYYDCILGAGLFHSGEADHVQGLRALDSNTIQIELVKPFPPFVYVLAGATAKILPADAGSDSNFFRFPIGSGPFQYVRTEETAGGKQIVLSSFKSYLGAAPELQEMVLRAVDETQARQEAISGAIHDLSNWPLTGKEEVFSIGQHFDSEVANTWVIGLNSRFRPLNSLQNRREFRKSFDAEGFRRRFYPDAVQAHGYIPPGFPGFMPEKSRQELKFEPVVAAPSSELIEIAIPKELAREKEIADFIEASFKKTGWNVKVRALGWAELMKRYDEKSLQGFLVAMNLDYPDSEFLLRNFESSNPDNFSGLKNPQFDALLLEARATLDRVSRLGIYRRLVSILDREALTINLFHPRGHYWVHQCVRGFKPNLLLDAYIDYRRVSLDGDCMRKLSAIGRVQ